LNGSCICVDKHGDRFRSIHAVLTVSEAVIFGT